MLFVEGLDGRLFPRLIDEGPYMLRKPVLSPVEVVYEEVEPGPEPNANAVGLGGGAVQ
jgi:hypothetical protein